MRNLGGMVEVLRKMFSNMQGEKQKVQCPQSSKR